MSTARTRVYRKGELESEDFPLADVSDRLAEPDTVVWVDFCQPDRNDLLLLADELGLHELAIEDALSPHQRPKIDHYETHRFLSAHAVTVDPDIGALTKIEVDAFISPRWLITVRKGEGFPIEPVLERWDRSDDLAEYGVGYLLYGLLDVIVDTYFDAIAAFDDYYDRVSDGIFNEQPLDPRQQRDWFQMRQSLMTFHRIVVPLRDALGGVMRREGRGIDDRLSPYFQDVYDHLIRVSESTDALRELVATIVETNLSLRDYRQNQVMKRVTSWAAIIAVPTLITGYFGMNVPYPGEGETIGVAVSSVSMVVISGALYVVFRKKDWL